jgi:DNA mismatch repair protein MutS2
MELQARLVITTHHGILKNYGYTRKGAENASMEFDGKTLAPTFRIVMGIPGESRALDIAERNGLPKEIVAKARNYLAEEQADISVLIEGLRKKHKELDAARDAGQAEIDKLKEERRKADLKELRLRQKELELKTESAGNFQRLFHESRKQLENLVRELKEGEITREKTLRVKEFLSNLEDSVNAENAELERETRDLRDRRMENEAAGDSGAPSTGQTSFEPGMEVLAGESRRRGRIVRQDKKGSRKNNEAAATQSPRRWIVEIGSMKMSFDETDLIRITASQKQPERPITNWAAELAPAEPVYTEINLLGMRTEEALITLRRQIDAAVLAGLQTFSVVHGKGDGILQNAVHEYLKKEKCVADFNFSRPELGGFGRTEVVLKLGIGD